MLIFIIIFVLICMVIGNLSYDNGALMENKYICHNCGSHFKKKWYVILIRAFNLTPMWLRFKYLGYGKCPYCESRDTAVYKDNNFMER